MAELILNAGSAEERVFTLADGTSTIGRTEDNAVFVLHKSMSRRHAQLQVTRDRVAVTDLESKNGTWVNGIRIVSCELNPGDLLRCGDVQFSFVVARGRAPAAPTMIRDIHTHFSRGSVADLLGKTAGKRAGAQEKLHVLLRVSQILSSPDAIEQLLEKILDLVFQILAVDRAAILLAGDDGQLQPASTKSRVALPPGEKVWSRHIVEFVRERSVAALFANAQEDPRLGDARSVMAQSICASMCAPLKPRDEVIGVLYVDNLSAPDPFVDEDLDFLTAFANQAAIAIDNSRLYRRIEAEAVLRNNLLRFFPPTTIQKLVGPTPGHIETIDTEVTALFADLSEFTALSSTMAPREVVNLLNEYFPVMADVVFRHEGTLEKYIGDALLAVWGAPFRHDDDVNRALKAAIEMQQALRELNRRWAETRGLQLHMHIGLNTGPVAAGNIGSDSYIQYATIGDATNVASRICSAAGQDEILIAEATLEKLGRPAVRTEEVAPVKVKGKDQPLRLHRVVWQET